MRGGYGLKKDAAGKCRNAHRVFWVERFGPIPEGLQIDHLCRVTACVNTDHLELVTHTENTRRGDRSKLSMEDARYIRYSSKTGVELARDLKVSTTTISDIRQGRIWREGA
jgi:hypothetical protein